MPTIDADDVVHEALGPGTPTHEGNRRRSLAARSCKPDGSIDRARSARKVFAIAESMRRQLEAIVHPVVYAAIHKWFDSLERPVGVASIPLLYETGHERDFDFVARHRVPARGSAVAVDSARWHVRGGGAAADRCADARSRESVAREFRHSDRWRRWQTTDRQVEEFDPEIRARAIPAPQTSSRLPILRVPSQEQSDLRRRYSIRDSAGIARAARCCDTGSACRCADPCRRQHGG